MAAEEATRGDLLESGKWLPPDRRTVIDGADPVEREAVTNLLVIDRKTFTRDCLVAAFDAHPLIGTVASAQTAEDALLRLSRQPPSDAALINLAADPFDEVALASLRNHLNGLLPTGRIAIMTSMNDDAHLIEGMRAGICGYLPSDTPLNVAADVLRLVGLGWTVYPKLTHSVHEARLGSTTFDVDIAEGLTSRQKHVLDGLRLGMTNRAIGARLGISERAIKAHVQELMRRLKVKNRTQVVARLAGTEIIDS
ncbi:response regulator transcription factor [Sphingomonas sp. IC-11]|uniref:response regulator transcription factor n=1 Tax=Sphingomonas sp. IC-11 TaxID=2898528 RepID=UPI001E3AD6D1|nr:response regulator transcription factor [Sphingomonas sp. IC-11]MCC2981317.1 response regulator transcription factor [Sphingomonas sp. IC4-52]MCD2317029.1 response regulator transcription factor [Sphingomonas sp. IC-11]